MDVSSRAATLARRPLALPSISSFTVRSWRRGYYARGAVWGESPTRNFLAGME